MIRRTAVREPPLERSNAETKRHPMSRRESFNSTDVRQRHAITGVEHLQNVSRNVRSKEITVFGMPHVRDEARKPDRAATQRVTRELTRRL